MWYVLVKQCKHRKLHKKLVYFSFFFFFFSFLLVFQYFPFGIWPHIYQHICWAWIIIERWTTNQVQVNSGLVKQTSIRRRVLWGKKQTWVNSDLVQKIHSHRRPFVATLGRPLAQNECGNLSTLTPIYIAILEFRNRKDTKEKPSSTLSWFTKQEWRHSSQFSAWEVTPNYKLEQTNNSSVLINTSWNCRLPTYTFSRRSFSFDFFELDWSHGKRVIMQWEGTLNLHHKV